MDPLKPIGEIDILSLPKTLQKEKWDTFLKQKEIEGSLGDVKKKKEQLYLIS